MTDAALSRFVKKYASGRDYLRAAVEEYVKDIAAGQYPAAEHCYQMEAGDAQKLIPNPQSLAGKAS
ncbi:MAG TPA: hypothetical protein VNT79_12605 [Phycisphaerae bacterium]|nr:hypothetical protein [Phycisphaerae bacterium]